jgi:coatomer subunit beta
LAAAEGFMRARVSMQFMTRSCESSSMGIAENLLCPTLETLARMKPSAAAKEVFLHDTKAAYAKMVAIEQVDRIQWVLLRWLIPLTQRKTAEKKEKETNKVVVQADDLISFRQFAKKSSADSDDVSPLRSLM